MSAAPGLSTARCGVYGRCGGCPLMPAAPAAQEAYKRAFVARELAERGVAPPHPPSWVAAPRAVGYRNRVRLRATARQIEFFNPEKAGNCVVLEPDVVRGIGALRLLAARDPELLRGVAHLELRTRDETGRWGLRVESAPGAPASGLSWASRLGERWRVLEPRAPALAPPICQRFRVAEGVWVDVPLDAFLQINSAVNRLLVSHLADGLVERGARSFADLFAGAGNFSLPLAARGLAGVAVEHNAHAVEASAAAARAQGLHGLRSIAADVFSWVREWGEVVDAVVCDAPRAGLREGVAPVADRARRFVVLCSCHVPSFARDVAGALARGFRLESIALFDMFPQTRHLEVVAWLRRE